MLLLLIIKFQQYTNMNKKQQELFIAFFQQIYETQQVLDFIKLKLAESRNFNPLLLFELLSGQTQKITIAQMRTYMADKIAVNNRELYEIFERFDWSRQGFISRKDFLHQIQPLVYYQEGNAQNKGTISAEIQGHFLSLIIEILKRFRILEVIRKQIKYIQPYDAFEYIGYLKIGHLSIGQLRKLFNDSDFNVTDKQLHFLLHGLRRRSYRDINLEAFSENIDPLEFGEYAAFQYQLDKQKQRQFDTQNRHKQQTMKRSRIQSQRIEHEFQKSERKKQAELDKQMQMQNEAGIQMVRYEEQMSKKMRKAVMEQDKIIRHRRAACEESLRHQLMRNSQEQIENQCLSSRRQQEEQVNIALAQSALQKQKEIQKSFRNFQRQKSIYNQPIPLRSPIKISRAEPLRQLEISKNSIKQSKVSQKQPQYIASIKVQSRKIYNKSASRKALQQTPKPQIMSNNQSLKKKYEYDLTADIEESNCQQNKFQTSRTRYETYRKIQKQSRRIEGQSRRRYYENSIKSKYQREEQISKIRPQEFTYTPLSHNLANDYETDLQQTRNEILQRRKRRQAQQNTINVR